jgi:hypothetical protein
MSVLKYSSTTLEVYRAEFILNGIYENSLDNWCGHESLLRSMVRFSVLVTLCVVNVSQSSQSCSNRQGKIVPLCVSTVVSVPTFLWCFAVPCRSTSVSCTTCTEEHDLYWRALRVSTVVWVPTLLWCFAVPCRSTSASTRGVMFRYRK